MLLVAGCAGDLPKGSSRDGSHSHAERAIDGADSRDGGGRSDSLGQDEQSATQVILLTGFGPFSGFPVNPSWESIKPLQGQRWGSFEVRTVELPVEWVAGPQQLLAALEQHKPTIVISSGVAGDATKMRLETTADNFQQGTDNLGQMRWGTPCVADGPPEYSTRLPLDRIAAALSSSIGAVKSDNAGAFLCNDIFYTLMHEVQSSGTMAGLIHVPPTGGRLTVADLTAAWRVVLDVVTTSAERLHQPEPWPVTVHSPPRYTP